METLQILKRALKAISGVLAFGADIQKDARQKLIADLHSICGKCEDAYGTVLLRLKPIRKSFSDPQQLANELIDFSADQATRDSFKPEHLCGEVDLLLDSLSNNLDSLKYAVDWNRITTIKEGIRNIGNFDAAILGSYDQFTRDLNELSAQLMDGNYDTTERVNYVKRVITEFEDELRDSIDSVRQCKDMVLQG
jgi:hypothetical protein